MAMDMDTRDEHYEDEQNWLGEDEQVVNDE